MGIAIDGHPNLKRILLDDDWEGHPLRKDYPLGGEPVRFSGEADGPRPHRRVGARRSTRARGSRSRSRRVLTTPQELRATGDIMTVNFGPNHPSTHGVLRLIVDLYGEDVTGLEAVDRLPAHRLREEHGAEDVVEVHHVSAAHRLRLVPEQRVRVRRRRREAARPRDPAEGDVDAHAPLRAEPHPLAPRLARYVGARAGRDLDVLVRVPRARA